MKPHESEKIEKTKSAYLASQKTQDTTAALWGILTIFVIFVLPRYIPAPFNSIVQCVAPAALFNSSIVVFPQFYRNRKGSLKLALYLVAFLWLVAFVGSLLILIGVIN